MNNELTAIINELEEEILSANSINEFILLIYGSSANDKTDILFPEIQNALWQLWRFSKTHADKLFYITKKLDEGTNDRRSE